MRRRLLEDLTWVALIVLAVAMFAAADESGRRVSTAQHGRVCPAPIEDA